jgi:hypothetical protein
MDSLVVSNKEYLDKLFGFFDKDHPNPFLMTFVCRVISCLLLVKMKEMLAYMKSQPNFLTKLLKHLNVPAVTDFLTKLINLETQPEAQGTLQWLCEQKLIHQIIQKFDSSNADVHFSPSLRYFTLSTLCRSCFFLIICDIYIYRTQNHSDVAQALLDIISASKPDSPLLVQLSSEETVQLLLEYMISKSKVRFFSLKVPNVKERIDLISAVCATQGSPSALQHGLTVIIGMLSILGTLIQSDDEGEDDNAQNNVNNIQQDSSMPNNKSGNGESSVTDTSEVTKKKSSEVPPWIRLLLSSLPRFKELLISPPVCQVFDSVWHYCC